MDYGVERQMDSFPCSSFPSLYSFLSHFLPNFNSLQLTIQPTSQTNLRGSGTPTCAWTGGRKRQGLGLWFVILELLLLLFPCCRRRRLGLLATGEGVDDGVFDEGSEDEDEAGGHP